MKIADSRAVFKDFYKNLILGSMSRTIHGQASKKIENAYFGFD